MTTIFEFTDYREYLKAYFKDRKKIDPKFSHRWLAQRLDLSTSNFILLVMQGKRNLNSSLCFKIAEVFKLSQKESEYFENLVVFSQAKTNKEKDLYFSRLAGLRKHLKIDKIEEHQYEYYSSWYNAVIRELITMPTFDGDPAALAKMLVPSISPRQAKRSIELLLKLGMIKREGKGYVQTSLHITTGPEVNSIAVVNFHKEMGRLALEALDRIKKNERNMTASTICLTDSDFGRVTKRIEDFRKELLAMAVSTEKGDRIYQFNFQIFPVSKKIIKKDGKHAA